MQLVRGKDIENYLQNSRVDTTVDRVRSKSKEDKNFAPKQNERDCPMTRKYFYFTTLIVTRDDVNEYMKYHAEYTKANRFKDIVCKIYI